MKRPNNFILSVLWGVALCLALTSCENFLDGDDIKDQIIEEIEIANTNPVSFYVEAEEGSGTVTPTQLRLKKKESFELRYKPLSSWRFIKWEVRDRVTKEVVNNTLVNILHVLSENGADQLQMVRISIAQTLSFILVLVYYYSKKHRAGNSPVSN